MQALPHAFPTVQTWQHFSRGVHALGASFLALLESAEDGIAIKTAPTTTAATTTRMQTPMIKEYARRVPPDRLPLAARR